MDVILMNFNTYFVGLPSIAENIAVSKFGTFLIRESNRIEIFSWSFHISDENFDNNWGKIPKIL